MALVPIHYKFPYKDHLVPIESLARRSKRGYLSKATGFSNISKRFGVEIVMKSSRRKDWFLVMASSESKMAEEQLCLLDSYFRKLKGDADRDSLESFNKSREHEETKLETRAKGELESLNIYLEKLNSANSKDLISSTFDDQITEDNLRSKDTNSGLERFKAFHQYEDHYDETSDFYLISILASVNIAVFLFEVASPIKNNDFGLFSLPLYYGAKINDLIMVGEWWRLVTPMFLHSGIFHVALGCWSLYTFGPQVCRGYGSFIFFLIYVLGGISGNFTSFLHTPAPTVGGTGPVFAIIGAWLIYQMQNKDVIEKDVSEDLFQKAIIITGLCFILSHFGPIDDWTHLGATFTGIAYGFFTCPMLQLDDSSSRTGKEEGIAFTSGTADPCKSLFVFTIFVLVLTSSLLVFIEGPFDVPLTDDLVYSLI